MNGIHIDFSEKQKQAIQDYIRNHNCIKFISGSGGFGSTSKVGFIIHETMIGYCIYIKCPYCNIEIDITDTDEW